MARGFSRGGGGGGRSGGSGGGFSFGGGGGSRSSGGGFGFSFGSSSSSRRSNSYGGGNHYHRRPRRPWHVPMFGRTVIISTRAQSLFSMFIVLIIFATAMCFFNARSVGHYNTEIKYQKELVEKFERADKDYTKLIEGAKNGTYEIQYFDLEQCLNSYGKFNVKTFINEDYPDGVGIYDIDLYRNGQKYYFIYFSYTFGGDTYYEDTFTQYTMDNLEDLMKLGNNPKKLAIAVGNLSGTEEIGDGVCAMNMDYSLEANQDYHYEVDVLSRLKSQKNSNLMTALIFLAVDLLIVGGIVFFLVKKYKNAQRQADADLEKTQAETKLAQEQAKQINRTCDYCGASIPDGDDLCPGCGSRVFEDKD